MAKVQCLVKNYVKLLLLSNFFVTLRLKTQHKLFFLSKNRMKKILLLLATCLVCYGTLHAVPAKRGFKTFTQADGKTITVQAVGDEFHHSVITQDGLTVQRADDGQFYYRTASGITGQLAHDAASRDAQELTFIAAQGDKLTPGAQPQTRARRAPATPRKVGQREMPTTGTPRIPVLLVNFADKQMSHTKAQIQSHYTQGSTSAYQSLSTSPTASTSHNLSSMASIPCPARVPPTAATSGALTRAWH